MRLFAGYYDNVNIIHDMGILQSYDRMLLVCMPLGILPWRNRWIMFNMKKWILCFGMNITNYVTYCYRIMLWIIY